MKKLMKAFSAALAVLLATSTIVTAAPSVPIEPFGPKADLRFGVMSDTHIGASTLANIPTNDRLIKAYQTFAAIDPDMDAVAVAGDVTESGTQAQYDTYKQIMDEYSTAKVNVLSMGNHDVTRDAQGGISRFEAVFGPATDDKVVSGYHFITLSPTDNVYNTATHAQHADWLDGRLAAATAEDPLKPVFIFIHQTAYDTCAGSRNSYMNRNSSLYDVFCKYPQVITFSGHSHSSPIDPRTIWQGDYTALNDGSVYYAALEYTHPLTAGTTNNTNVGYSPYNRGESSTAMVVDVDGSKVTIRRFDLYYGKEIAAPFVFDLATPKENRPYRDEARIDESAAPTFASGAKVTVSNMTDTGCAYTFPQALNQSAGIPDDGAFTYAVSISDLATGEVVHTSRLNSSYFMVPPPPTVTYNATGLQKNKSYRISVTPMNFYGKEGESLTDTFLLATPLALSTDANLETGGSEDYFRVNTSLQTVAASNTAKITYTYDTEKFAFRGYTAPEGVTVLDSADTAVGHAITVMIDDYTAQDLGQALFSGRDGVALATTTNVMNVRVDYVVKSATGVKSVEIAAGNISFTSVGEGGVPGDYDGDGEITLIDLSNIIDLFGTTSANADWDQAQFFDLNANGEIDIYDISSIAKRLQ